MVRTIMVEGNSKAVRPRAVLVVAEDLRVLLHMLMNLFSMTAHRRKFVSTVNLFCSPLLGRLLPPLLTTDLLNRIVDDPEKELLPGNHE